MRRKRNRIRIRAVALVVRAANPIIVDAVALVVH